MRARIATRSDPVSARWPVRSHDEPQGTLLAYFGLFNCAAPWCGLIAVFSVAAPESPELPTSRRKQEDGNVARWPTIPRDRTGSRRTRSIRNQGVDRDAAHASGHQEMSGTSPLAGDPPTPSYSCAPSMSRCPAACDDDERQRLRLQARPPRTRCAGGRGSAGGRESRTGGRPQRRTWTVESRNRCPAGRQGEFVQA